MKQQTRVSVLDRAHGLCELCYGSLSVLSVHHRRPRQMGGTRAPWINDPENLLVLCGSGTTGCHGWVESHRADGYHYGWLVRSGFSPAETPFCDRKGQWWLLVVDGKHRIELPFDTPHPSSSSPRPGVGLQETPREDNNDRPY